MIEHKKIQTKAWERGNTCSNISDRASLSQIQFCDSSSQIATINLKETNHNNLESNNI